MKRHTSKQKGGGACSKDIYLSHYFNVSLPSHFHSGQILLTVQPVHTRQFLTLNLNVGTNVLRSPSIESPVLYVFNVWTWKRLDVSHQGLLGGGGVLQSTSWA